MDVLSDILFYQYLLSILDIDTTLCGLLDWCTTQRVPFAVLTQSFCLHLLDACRIFDECHCDRHISSRHRKATCDSCSPLGSSSCCGRSSYRYLSTIGICNGEGLQDIAFHRDDGGCHHTTLVGIDLVGRDRSVSGDKTG